MNFPLKNTNTFIYTCIRESESTLRQLSFNTWAFIENKTWSRAVLIEFKNESLLPIDSNNCSISLIVFNALSNFLLLTYSKHITMLYPNLNRQIKRNTLLVYKIIKI